MENFQIEQARKATPMARSKGSFNATLREEGSVSLCGNRKSGQVLR